MGIPQVFQNLTESELEKALIWYDHLQASEKPRLLETLEILNKTDFTLSEQVDEFGFHTPARDRVAVIVSGTSINSHYRDIDLFILTENSLSDSKKYWRAHPGRVFNRTFNYIALPEHVYCVSYGTMDLDAHILAELNRRKGTGAIVTFSLFYELEGFEVPRPGHPDDLIEPNPKLGAEETIEYNIERGTKFRVLSRQYKVS